MRHDVAPVWLMRQALILARMLVYQRSLSPAQLQEICLESAIFSVEDDGRDAVAPTR